MKKKSVDSMDIRVLNILMQCGGIANSRLAERINLSQGSTLVRVQKLWEKGIIKACSAIIDYKFFGYDKYSYFQVAVLEMHSQLFRERLLSSRFTICFFETENKDDILSKAYIGIILAKSLESAADEMRKMIDGVAGIKVVAFNKVTMISQKSLVLEEFDIVR